MTSGARNVLGLLLVGLTLAGGGCFRLTPGANAGGSGDVSEVAIQGFLAEMELARPELVAAVAQAMNEGRRYRQRVRDQKLRWALVTAWLDRDQQDVFNVVVKRDATCPRCRGSQISREGWRGKAHSLTDRVSVEFQCPECEGTGIIKNDVTKRSWILEPGDYVDAAAAKQRHLADAYEGAPPETRDWVAKLASEDARTRLEACLWLDANYVREGVFFRKYSPMLAKARRHESNAKRSVYQFWAGRDAPGEEQRAYYRIYVDNESGKITQTGFYP